jgi:hypothetical protein
MKSGWVWTSFLLLRAWGGVFRAGFCQGWEGLFGGRRRRAVSLRSIPHPAARWNRASRMGHPGKRWMGHPRLGGATEIQGSLHCAGNGEAVPCFGRDDVFHFGLCALEDGRKAVSLTLDTPPCRTMKLCVEDGAPESFGDPGGVRPWRWGVGVRGWACSSRRGPGRSSATRRGPG